MRVGSVLIGLVYIDPSTTPLTTIDSYLMISASQPHALPFTLMSHRATIDTCNATLFLSRMQEMAACDKRIAGCLWGQQKWQTTGDDYRLTRVAPSPTVMPCHDDKATDDQTTTTSDHSSSRLSWSLSNCRGSHTTSDYRVRQSRAPTAAHWGRRPHRRRRGTGRGERHAKPS